MAGLLLILVVLNAFATGWLLAQVKRIRRVVGNMAKVQRDMSYDIADHDYVTEV